MSLQKEDPDITKEKYNRIRTKHPHRLPIVVEAEPPLVLSQTKFLVPESFSIGQLLIAIRKRIKEGLHASDALFLLVGGKLFASLLLVQNVWEENNVNGFLIVGVSKENAFGK